MKKLFALILLIAIGAGWYVWHKDKADDLEIAPAVSKPDASDATFLLEGDEVTLTDGKAEIELAPGSLFTATTRISDIVAYGDVNGDRKNDTALLLVSDGGGSGIFVYVAAYVSGNVDYKGSNAVFVGDRISPESLSIENGIITLEYLDRRSDQAMSEAPTVRTEKLYVYREGSLEER